MGWWFQIFDWKFGSKNLELLKQKGAYPYEYMNSYERFNEERLPDKVFTDLQKMEQLMKNTVT